MRNLIAPYLLLLLASSLLTSCTKQAPGPVDGAGVAAGKYTGAFHTADRIYNDEVIFIHRLEGSTVQITFQDTLPVFPIFDITVERNGPAIHQPFGTEASGTFILDLAATPDNIRFEMPDGRFFDGIRLNNFHE